MRWQGDRESENIEDRRGTPGGPMVITGGLGTLVIVLVSLYLGIDPTALLQQVGGQQGPMPAHGAGSRRPA